MYLVYILYSERLKKFYTGFTIDLKQRLEFHQNAASTKFTHNANDWTLYLTVECKSKEQGLARLSCFQQIVCVFGIYTLF